ncbi:hypothetical protein [Streptomyces sp. Ag109_G2-15]|uniref:hypothetical protein n=1 Tax=Streptomyces sp. Ag109_G2-15 TaxID=1938850 RepID=UPI000BE242E6|nr:hypothetical protein [Streptomyces sp. Ag109_G2-15]
MTVDTLRTSRLVPGMLPSVRAPIDAALAKGMMVLVGDGRRPSSIARSRQCGPVHECVDVVEGLQITAQVGIAGDEDRTFARRPGVVNLGRDGHSSGSARHCRRTPFGPECAVPDWTVR